LKDVKVEKSSIDDFIVHYRNKESTYWFNNWSNVGDYLGHGGLHLVTPKRPMGPKVS